MSGPIRRIVNPGFVVAAVAIAIATVLSCSSSASTGVMNGALALGTWGGDSSGLIVSDTAMHLHIGCTFGDVSGPSPSAATVNSMSAAATCCARIRSPSGRQCRRDSSAMSTARLQR